MVTKIYLLDATYDVYFLIKCISYDVYIKGVKISVAMR